MFKGDLSSTSTGDFFYILLTVHLSIILVNGQLNPHSARNM